MSTHFGEFVAQQQIVRDSGPADESRSLSDIIGPPTESDLANGLADLSMTQLRLLLANPGALVELHEFVYLNSIESWFDRENVNTEQPELIRLRQNILKANSLAKTSFLPEPTTIRFPRRSLLLSMLVAATVLLIGGLAWLLSPDSNPGDQWGWLAESSMPQNVDSSNYLLALADGSEAWFDKVPTDESEYLKRLDEFRAGCQRLIDAPHSVLSNEDRTWLVQKCQTWNAKLDEQKAAFASGDQTSFEESLQLTNEIAKAITKAIRQKADSGESK